RRIPTVPSALAPNPITIVTGASGVLTATLAPPPLEAGALSLAGGDASIAPVPASVAFAAGQAEVPIPVTGVSIGSTTLKASLNGVSVTAQVLVVLSLAPANGAAGTLVTLSGTPFDPVPA